MEIIEETEPEEYLGQGQIVVPGKYDIYIKHKSTGGNAL
jgi:hypothetical protein